MERCPWVQITPYYKYIQEFPQDFYEQFLIIICGLDNVEARRWINAMVHQMVKFDKAGNPEINTILIDGGTEGLKGQARVIEPFKTGCYECSMGSLPPETTYPLCTIKETPRLPEHCIQYAFVIEWPLHFPNKKLDADVVEDMQWVTQKAEERAKLFGIEGVDYRLTLGVVKNIIPAVASTNALVAAACCNETFKILTGCNYKMNNYMQYMGQTRVTVSCFAYERSEDCLVCSRKEFYQTV
jgi:ubiquitin-activating enzyme E1 C